MPLEADYTQGIVTVDVCVANGLLHGNVELFPVEKDPFEQPPFFRSARPNFTSLIHDLNRRV